MKEWAKKFYLSDAWSACRDGFLASKGFLCERCSSEYNPVAAKIAHHRTYLTRDNINDPSIALNWNNLEALCQDCHNREHHRTGPASGRYRFDENGDIKDA